MDHVVKKNIVWEKWYWGKFGAFYRLWKSELKFSMHNGTDVENYFFQEKVQYWIRYTIGLFYIFWPQTTTYISFITQLEQ